MFLLHVTLDTGQSPAPKPWKDGRALAWTEKVWKQKRLPW